MEHLRGRYTLRLTTILLGKEKKQAKIQFKVQFWVPVDSFTYPVDDLSYLRVFADVFIVKLILKDYFLSFH